MELIQLRKIIYQFDIPKDLAVTTGWTKEQHVKIKNMIEAMFGPIRNSKWHAIGDHTYAIDELLRDSLITTQMYTNPVRIVRLKYTTGHLATPRDLFLVQDNGPIDIIYKPKILIGIGAIPDPAGKTKIPSTNESYTIINLVQQGRYTTLPLASLQAAGFEMILNGDITITYYKGIYTLQLPTTLGMIKETFNEKFEPISGIPKPSYFAGNREKNPEIKNDLDDTTSVAKIPSKKYALCKLVGDALQVAHTDYMVTEQSKLPVGEATFVRANTVVGTTDNGVKKQCIASNVGCIHTDSLGVSRQFIPQGSSPAEQELIRRQQIEMIGNELLAHNQSVITLLGDVANSTNRDNEWVDPVTWRTNTRGKAKTYLQKKLGELISFNEDLTRTVAQLRESATEENLVIVKEIKNSERFRSPFVRFKGYYKKMLTVRSILPNGRIPFVVSRFTTTTSFNSMEGGRRIQKGGENTERLERIMQNIKYLGGNLKRIPALLCYINEFTPELITYARCMNTAMNMIDPRKLVGAVVPENTDRVLRRPIIHDEYLKIPSNYRWEDDTFVLLDGDGKEASADLIREVYKNTNIQLLHVAIYSKLFTDLFTDTHDAKHLPFNEYYNAQAVDLDSLNKDGMDMVSSIAITLYENEYRMEIMSTHGDLSPEARAEELRRIVNEIAECGRENPEREEYSLLYDYYSRMLPASATAPSASAASASSSSSSAAASSSAAPLAPGSPPRLPFLEPEPATLQRKKRSARSNNENDGSGRKTFPKLPLFNKAPVNGSQQAAKPNSQIQTLSQGFPQGFASQNQSQRQGGKRRTYKKRKQKKRTTRHR